MKKTNEASGWSKVALLLTALLITVVSMAQKTDSIKVAPVGTTLAKASSVDTLVIEKAKFIKIGQKVYSVEELGRPEAIALMVPLTWIVANYQYLDNSNGGLSKKQVEELQQPLAQYYQYYMYMLQQRQQQSQPKQ